MKIAIQGHLTRGKEVIQILENLGGKNVKELTGTHETFYYINDKNEIIDDHKKYIPSTYQLYTLEEFEKEFPFKIGDNVQIEINNIIHLATITDIVDKGIYKVKYTNSNIGFVNKEHINIYNKMSARNITLTLDKAKEWYNKGGELKEIALQVFTKEELNPLPKSWEEYCKMYKVPAMIFGPRLPSKYIALWKLEQLRDCYRQGWKPGSADVRSWSIWNNGKSLFINNLHNNIFLSFQSKEIAEEFLKNFEPLIKEAGDLI